MIRTFTDSFLSLVSLATRLPSPGAGYVGCDAETEMEEGLFRGAVEPGAANDDDVEAAGNPGAGAGADLSATRPSPHPSFLSPLLQCRDLVELIKVEGIAETERKKLAKESRNGEEAARLEQLQKEERSWAKQRIVLAEEQKSMLEWELARIQM
jgi:hypothetical protein